MSTLTKSISFFFFTDTSTTEIYTLSLTTLFRSQQFAAEQLQTAEASVNRLKAHLARQDYSAVMQTAPSVRAELAALQTTRSEEHTSELQSQSNLVCRLLLEKKKKNTKNMKIQTY